MTEVVIKMSDEMYDWFINGFPDKVDMDELQRLVINGTVLPKGHGRLGDLDFVAKRIKAKPPIGEIGKATLEECYQEILQADTVIEADGGNK